MTESRTFYPSPGATTFTDNWLRTGKLLGVKREGLGLKRVGTTPSGREVKFSSKVLIFDTPFAGSGASDDGRETIWVLMEKLH